MKDNDNNKIPSENAQVNKEFKFKAFILLAMLLLLFGPVLWELIQIWNTQEDYSHGFFVIPISIFIVWAKRKEILNSPLKSSWIGIAILILGLIIYLIAFIARFHTLTYLSMILTICGIVVYLGGFRLFKILMLPVFFLIFMFPIPTAYYILITNPLKLFITKISADIIYSIGIPVYREGNLITLANTSLEVVEACSGIRSLYSYLMLGFLFAFMSKRWSMKTILVASTFPLAILVNIIRVTGTGILSNYYGPEVAQGFFHEFAGFMLFAIGFVVLFLEFYILDRLFDPKTS